MYNIGPEIKSQWNVHVEYAREECNVVKAWVVAKFCIRNQTLILSKLYS